MKRYRNALGRTVGLLLCMACLCGTAMAKPVTIAVSQSFFALPAIIAASEGYFEHPTSPVKMLPCMGGVRCLQMLTEGEAQFATAGDMPITLAAFKPNPPTVLATLASSSQNTKLLATGASGIQGFAGLSGKRVALVKFSNAHYHLDVSVLFARGNPAHVTIMPSDPAAVGDLLRQGQVDAAIVWEPHATRALASVPGLQHIRGGRIYVETFNLIARPDASHTDAAKVVLKGLIRAADLIEKQPLRAREIAVRELKITPQQAEYLLALYHFDVGLSQGLITTMESQARWAISQKIVPPDSAMPNFLSLVQGDVLRSIQPAAVNLVQ